MLVMIMCAPGVWLCLRSGDPHEVSHERTALQVSGLRARLHHQGEYHGWLAGWSSEVTRINLILSAGKSEATPGNP